MISKTTFKVPNFLITDFKFEPEDKDNEKEHPILGTVEVRNIHELDWEALKSNALEEWSHVCQEHYEALIKLANEPS